MTVLMTIFQPHGLVLRRHVRPLLQLCDPPCHQVRVLADAAATAQVADADLTAANAPAATAANQLELQPVDEMDELP